MEERKEDDGSLETLVMLMNTASIEPPRLEDAGLENCALPPESIMEAFSLAAASCSRCRFIDDDEDEDDDDSPDPDGGQSSGVAGEKTEIVTGTEKDRCEKEEEKEAVSSV